MTIVVERPPVSGFSGDDAFRAITLAVHSSLNAVGFIAAVARALADAGIPANVFAGYHHDHLLVPAAQANDAMSALCQLAGSA